MRIFLIPEVPVTPVLPPANIGVTGNGLILFANFYLNRDSDDLMICIMQ